MNIDGLKKVCFIILCLHRVLAYGQSVETTAKNETWSRGSSGWEYDFFEPGGTFIPEEIRPKSFLSIGQTGYVFTNKKKTGIFAGYNFSFLLPNSLEQFQAGIEVKKYVPPFKIDLNLGLAFRRPLNGLINIYGGLGVKWEFMASNGLSAIEWNNKTGPRTEESFKLSLGGIGSMFGILGDIGVKIDISEKMFISLGSAAVFNIKSEKLNTVKTAYYNVYDEHNQLTGVMHMHEQYAGKESIYGLLGVRPYISIGRNAWSIIKTKGKKGIDKIIITEGVSGEGKIQDEQ